MSKVLVTNTHLSDIGNAIRSKNGESTRYKPGDMAAAIGRIESGYPEPTGTVQITANGTHNVKDYASADVDVSNSYAAEDEGKVVQSGALVVQTSLNVTTNGTYDTTTKNSVVVNVEGGGDDPFALANYIESSGTQYIDTGYVPKANTTVEMVASVKNISSYQILFGCRYAANSRQFWIDRSYSNSVFNDGYGNTNNILVPSSRFWLFTGDKIFLQKSSIGSFARTASIYTAVGNPHSNVFTEIGLPIYLFALNTNGSVSSYGYFKLYRFRIFEDDTLVHEFIPWQESGVACLKDTVTSEIKYNAGTGVFVYGTDS